MHGYDPEHQKQYGRCPGCFRKWLSLSVCGMVDAMKLATTVLMILMFATVLVHSGDGCGLPEPLSPEHRATLSWWGSFHHC